MTTRAEIMMHIEEAADFHMHPVNLITAIVSVESSFNPSAFLHEPRFYARYILGGMFKPIPPCSKETEAWARATSWGLMQVMGQVARERGFKGTFLTDLCIPVVGIYWGCEHLGYLRSRYEKTHGIEGVVAAYNAGSPRKNHTGKFINQAYVEKVREAGGFKS
jgi:soluble lytic murein transglycosylase-like protein